MAVLPFQNRSMVSSPSCYFKLVLLVCVTFLSQCASVSHSSKIASAHVGGSPPAMDAIEQRMFGFLKHSPSTSSNTPKVETLSPQLRGSAPSPPRFASVQSEAEAAPTAIQKMKTGICACKWIDSTTSTKPIGVGVEGKCAPRNALCGFCMNAAYAAYWNPEEDTCAQYMNGAKTVCTEVAKGAMKAGKEIGYMYEMYGPQFGASTVWCRDNGCCLAMEGPESK